MASIAFRSRLMPRLAKFGSCYLRIFSTEASYLNSSAKVPGSSGGQSIFSDIPQAESVAAEALGKDQKGFKFLSYGLVWALTGATAAAGYTSYVSAKPVEMYLELRELVEEHVKGFTEPLSEKLLPDLHPSEQHVYTLVLDLNETLLYTYWKRDRGWRTFKRPGVDTFLEHLAKFWS